MAGNDLATQARDAVYTAVGFGVLGFQRLQVRRQELVKQVGGKDGVVRFVRQVEAKVDPVLDDVEKRLPDQARTAVHRARLASKTVERLLLR